MCVTHMDATKIVFSRNRDRLVSELGNQSNTKSEEIEIPVEKRFRRESYQGKRKMMYVKHLQEVKRIFSRMS